MGGEGAVGPEDVVLLQMVQYGIKWGTYLTTPAHHRLRRRRGQEKKCANFLFAGALMVTLEHRFYGKSQPLPDLSIQSLRYLSSEQAYNFLSSLVP